MKKKIYAVVDLETTGGSSSYDRITEVAIVLFDGDKIIDSFESLIHPECTIPPHITQITAITNEMVADAPRFFEVAKTVVEMTEGAIFVAHNVRFDYGFLREEFSRLGYTFTRRQLCTVRLSRKMIPDSPSYSLGRITRHLGIKIENRHRAMGDALATTELLQLLLHEEKSMQEIHQLVNLGIKETRLPEGITLGMLHELPEECGVYYFHDDSGKVVYVGKSLNIKKRVMQHFSKTTRKADYLHQYARSISYEITGSELIALLYESQEIKRLRPFINKAQRIRQFQYVIHAFRNKDGYLCFEAMKATAKMRQDLDVVAEYPKIGTAKRYLQRVVEEYELCRRLCGLESNIGSCIYYQIKECQGGCIGKEAPDSYNQRAEEAKSRLDIYFEQDFLILDKGRNSTEKSVVLIEDGQYKGYGYVEKDLSNGRVQELRDAVRPCLHHPENLKILRYFLKKNPEVKCIPLNSR